MQAEETTMALWEWAAAGAIFVAVVVLCVRLMKRGLSTLEDERARCLERIREMEEKLRKIKKIWLPANTCA